jgi:hypothetical protein
VSTAPTRIDPAPAPAGDESARVEPTGGTPDERGPEAAPHRRRRRVLVVLAAVVLLVLLAGGWLAFQVYRAGTALLDARSHVDGLTELTRSGDVSGLSAALPGLQADLDRARAAAASPVWSAALVVPWVGDQLRAVRTVTVSLDDVATAAGPALGAVDTALASHDAPGQGRLELAPLVDALPAVVTAADSVTAATQAIGAIDTAGLTPRLAEPVAQLQDQLAQVSSAVDSGARVARLLPSMLGADGPRTYLLASLNSAELRAEGGIVGAFAVLRADDGVVDLLEQKTTADFPGVDTPVLAPTATERLFQTNRLGRWVQDAVMTPDYPRAAQLLATRWTADTGQQVDGVIATDPVAVSWLLAAIGPVTEPSGMTLDSDTLIPELLHDTYLRLEDPDDADQFFTDVAATVFHAVGNGQGDRKDVLDALVRAAQAGRVRVWSAHDDEQALIAGSTVGAAFLSGDVPDAAGVFLDDGTAGKLDYYLTTTVSVEDITCTGPAPTATIRLDLAYDPPADVASQPRYITGYPTSDLPTGWLATNVSVYTPVGASLGSLRLGDGYIGGKDGTADGRAVQVVTSWLAPGERATYRATVPVRNGSLTVWSTPTLTSDGLLTVSCSSDG